MTIEELLKDRTYPARLYVWTTWLCWGDNEWFVATRKRGRGLTILYQGQDLDKALEALSKGE